MEMLELIPYQILPPNICFAETVETNDYYSAYLLKLGDSVQLSVETVSFQSWTLEILPSWFWTKETLDLVICELGLYYSMINEKKGWEI